MTAKTNEPRVRIHTNEKLLEMRVKGLMEGSGPSFRGCLRTAFNCAKVQMLHMPPEFHGAYNHTGLDYAALVLSHHQTGLENAATWDG